MERPRGAIPKCLSEASQPRLEASHGNLEASFELLDVSNEPSETSFTPLDLSNAPLEASFVSLDLGEPHWSRPRTFSYLSLPLSTVRRMKPCRRLPAWRLSALACSRASGVTQT